MEKDGLHSIRRQLIKRAERRKAWVVNFTPESPIKWKPYSTIDPRTGECFTESSAKEFVTETLRDEKIPLTEIVLGKPPGKRGYEIIVETEFGPIYIKLQLGSGRIIGRSFHYSDR